MSSVFKRRRDGVSAQFGPDDAKVIRHVVGEIAGMLGTEPDRTDPVLDRLFPAIYPNDPIATAEMRQYAEDDLRAGKVAAATALLDSLPPGGGRVRLDAETAESWLMAINDVRLALGVRLSIADDSDLTRELDEAVAHGPTTPRAAQLLLYGYLSYLQESLVEALTG